MENYEIKTVPFLGDELMAARDNSGQIWAGISYICNGIGLSKNQKDRQIKNVQADRVLSKGCVKFDAGVFDPYNEAVGMKLDFIPLWLAKINITSTMESETPEVADKLEQYQLKAKDVLAAAFIQPPSALSPTQLLAETTKALAQQAEIILDLDQRVTALTDKANTLTEQTAALTSRMDNAVRVFSRPNTIGEWNFPFA